MKSDDERRHEFMREAEDLATEKGVTLYWGGLMQDDRVEAAAGHFLRDWTPGTPVDSAVECYEHAIDWAGGPGHVVAFLRRVEHVKGRSRRIAKQRADAIHQRVEELGLTALASDVSVRMDTADFEQLLALAESATNQEG